MIFAPRVDAGLPARGGFLDAHLGDPRLDGFGHAAQRFNLVEYMVPGLVHELVGEALHIVAAGPGTPPRA